MTASAASKSPAEGVARVAGNDPERNRKKKGHSGNHQEDDGDAKLDIQGNNETSKRNRKEKKKKRMSEGQTVSIVE